MEDIKFWLIFGGVIAAGYAVGAFLASSRRKALENLAASLGLPFSPSGMDAYSLARSTGLEVFGASAVRDLFNFIEMRSGQDGPDLVFMDCAYKMHRSTRVFSLVLADLRAPLLPAFEVFPKDLSLDVGLAFGGGENRIDLPDLPAFSSGYVLTGSDRARVEGFFRAGAAKCFEGTSHIQAQSTGRYFSMHLYDSTVPVSDYAGHMEAVRALVLGLMAAAGRAPRA